MKITREVVEYVAHLGRLDLEPHEVDLYTDQPWIPALRPE